MKKKFNEYRKSSVFTSKYRGVSFRKDRNKWVVSGNFEGVSKKYGAFDTEIEAALRWDELAEAYYGKGNFVPNIPEPIIT